MKIIKINLNDIPEKESMHFFIRSKLIEAGIILQPPIKSPYDPSGFNYFIPLDGTMETIFNTLTNTYIFKYHEPSDIYPDPNRWATKENTDPIKDILEGCGRLGKE